MPGKGKYSFYDSPPDNSGSGTVAKKKSFLKKLFSGAPSMDMQTVVDRAKQLMLPAVQEKADPSIFDGGKVDLSYSSAPKLSDVKWSKPGDPSTPYTPDIRSPGAATGVDLSNMETVVTNLSPLTSDPGLKPTDISPNFVPGVPTASPDQTSVAVSEQQLGVQLAQSNVSSPAPAQEIYKTK